MDCDPGNDCRIYDNEIRRYLDINYRNKGFTSYEPPGFDYNFKYENFKGKVGNLQNLT